MVRGNEKKERTYPPAIPTTTSLVNDHEGEAEEAPSAEPPVALSAKFQTDKIVVPCACAHLRQHSQSLRHSEHAHLLSNIERLTVPI
jgi:hypothetical protein